MLTVSVSLRTGHHQSNNKERKMEKFLAIFNFLKEWVKDRLAERTTWDGAVLIGAGVSFFLFKGIATFVAWAAIIYGAWTLWKKELKDKF